MSETAQRALEGCPVSGARLIRWLEDDDPRGAEAMKVLHAHPRSGRAHIVGVTGPPGAGKSTLVDGLVTEWRKAGNTVGVLAVDPSSPFSGGAILGDRVRMQQHATDPGVFIRSMATRGRLGGLSRKTHEAAVVLEAMGFEQILVETVGVGQDELEVVELAHTTIVVSVPGLGDDIQALKAGIFEIGDVFVINKADRPGVDETEKQLTMMLHLRAPPEGGSPVPLLRTVAHRGEGLDQVVAACQGHARELVDGGDWLRKGANRNETFFRELVRDRVAQKVMEDETGSTAFSSLLEQVRAQKIDPYTAMDRLLSGFDFKAREPGS
ncbi:MAG: methylmalonyl Co-A mutase-associated GTPase MeaB [Spirochaeta sp.]|nr:methylmalonyl Co-A mutase-associated GTPase MeaB [Spirochaeta sp.]RPG08531.1 MAG: methylmalonyl Co-A mutase-associated GTPase MeaB [Proteobacteria bacterium TMED72]